MTDSPNKSPKSTSPRFTLELEFVLSLSNPYYLSHLALAYPHLLNKPASTSNKSSTEEDDATRFASYLKYLYQYWKTPEYSRFLTHPGAVLRNLELLQQDRFRKDIIRPDLIVRLLEGKWEDKGHDVPVDATEDAQHMRQ